MCIVYPIIGNTNLCYFVCVLVVYPRMGSNHYIMLIPCFVQIECSRILEKYPRSMNCFIFEELNVRNQYHNLHKQSCNGDMSEKPQQYYLPEWCSIYNRFTIWVMTTFSCTLTSQQLLRNPEKQTKYLRKETPTYSRKLHGTDLKQP